MNLMKSKVVKNAGWLIAGKLAQMVLSFFVGLITARYLGPSNYGLISYAGAYTTFFSALCTLGINSVLVKEFVDHPDGIGETLGTTIVLRVASSGLSVLMIAGISAFVDKAEPLTMLVVVLYSISLVFQVFEAFNYWFQYKLQSKYCSAATLVAYIVVSAYKIVLLISKKDVAWFAISAAVDHVVIAAFLWLAYKRLNGPNLSVSWNKAKAILGKSRHFIVAGLMVSIYASTDKLMLKQLLSETEVGYYTTATAICGLWVFVLSAIIDSMNPVIMQLYQKSQSRFRVLNKQLYAIVFYISVAVSIGFVCFGKHIVWILYGEEFLLAVTPLKIITWYTAFSYLGVARNTWIVCENKQKYLDKWVNPSGPAS